MDIKKDDISRKPRPGMILKAQAEFHLDLGKSILIGDKIIDIQAGIAAEVVITLLLNTEKLSEMSGLKYYSLWINKSRRYSSTDISK
jgi:D-glycero-D-manno-heptose 1,7-bisphosphate phosphatase